MQPLVERKVCIQKQCSCIWSYTYVDDREIEKETKDVVHFIQIYRTDDGDRHYYVVTSEGTFIYNNIYKYEIRPLKNEYSGLDGCIDQDPDHFSKVEIYYEYKSSKSSFNISLYGNTNDYVNGQHPFINFLMNAMFV